jgi:hypothetical protein
MISALRSAMGWFSQGKANFEESGADFVTPRQANDSLPFDRFSSFLPYSGYDEEHRLFVIESDQPGKPEGWGFTLEVQPQIGASQEMANFMVNLFSYMDAPEFARLSIHDGSKVKIAPVHSDFDCGLRRGP